MSIKKLPLALAASMLSSAHFAQAQTGNPDNLAPVVVSASRTAQRLTEALSATTVISRADIERSQALDVVTLLAREAGVEITQNGGIGTVSSIFLRGTESRNTLVMIDGQPINNLNFSMAALEQLTPDMIDRIEIVRGNVSSMYGSSAVGGLIQIFTRNGTGPARAVLSVEAGSRRTRKGSASIGGSVENGLGVTSAFVGISALRTDGYSAIDASQRPNANPDDDGYRNTNVAASLTHLFKPGQEVGMRFNRFRGRTDYDQGSSWDASTDVHKSKSLVQMFSAYAQNRLTDRWSSRVQIGEGRDQIEATVQSAYPYRYFVNSRTRTVSWQNDIALAPNQTLVAAAEWQKQQIDSDTIYTRDARTIKSARLGYQGRIGAHQWQLNVRHDDYSDYDNANTWYAGYGFVLSPAWKLIASASTAYTAPTFNDLYYPVYGNPSLIPEKSRSVEGGVQYAAADNSVRMTLFSTRFRDLIGYDNLGQRANIDKASVEGMEWIGATKLGAVHLRSTLTWQNPMNDSTHTRLLRRAKLFGSIAADYSFAQYDLGAVFRASGSRPDWSNQELGGYAVLDLTARYRISKELSLGARVQNLFDREYQTAYSYNTPRRGVFFNLSYQPRF